MKRGRIRTLEDEKAQRLGISRYTLWRYRTGRRKPDPAMRDAIRAIDEEFKGRPRFRSFCERGGHPRTKENVDEWGSCIPCKQTKNT